MVTIGSRLICPQCSEEALEHERRLNTGEDRGECSECGYFYEFSYREILKLRLKLDEDEALAGEKLDEIISDMHYYEVGNLVFRIGRIQKTDDTRGLLHIVDLTWFIIPSLYMRKGTEIQWMAFSPEELADFDWRQWRGREPHTDSPDEA